MLRVFQTDIADPKQFVVTLELVPGRESTGRSVDTVMGIARDAFADGRVSAVSITDNPGGNPSLSPDVIGYRDLFHRHGRHRPFHLPGHEPGRHGKPGPATWP